MENLDIHDEIKKLAGNSTMKARVYYLFFNELKTSLFRSIHSLISDDNHVSQYIDYGTLHEILKYSKHVENIASIASIACATPFCSQLAKGIAKGMSMGGAILDKKIVTEVHQKLSPLLSGYGKMDQIIDRYSYKVLEYHTDKISSFDSDALPLGFIKAAANSIMTKDIQAYVRKEIDQYLSCDFDPWKEIMDSSIGKFFEAIGRLSVDSRVEDGDSTGDRIGNRIAEKAFRFKDTVSFNVTNTFNYDNAHKLALIADLTYMDSTFIRNVINGDIIDRDSSHLRVITNCNDEKLILAFRGSSTYLNWLRNADFNIIDMLFNGTNIGIHRGFYRSLESLWDELKNSIDMCHGRYKINLDIFLTGHSLGGALASIAALRIMNSSVGHPDKIHLYTYGQPQWHISEPVNAIKHYNRITNVHDPVPCLLGNTGYVHSGTTSNHTFNLEGRLDSSSCNHILKFKPSGHGMKTYVEIIRRASQNAISPSKVKIEDIFLYSYSGDLEKIQGLIQNSSVDIIHSRQALDGRTVLHYAVQLDQAHVVKYLIEKGANVEGMDFNNNTSLHYCIKHQSVKSIGLLFNRANSAYLSDEEYLIASILLKDQSEITLSLRKIWFSNKKSSRLEVKYEKWAKSAEEFYRNIDITAMLLLKYIDKRVLLTVGLLMKNLSLIEQALKEFDTPIKSLDAKDHWDQNAIHIAARVADEEVVMHLLGLLGLLKACSWWDLRCKGSGNDKVLENILNRVDSEGYTALSIIAEQGNADLLHVFFTQEASKYKTLYGINSLHIAILGGHLNFVRELLKKFPDLKNEYDDMNYSPQDIASYLCKRDILSALGESSDSFGLSSARCNSSVLASMQGGGVFSSGIKKYVDKVVRNDNATALFVAAEAGNIDAVGYLIDKGATLSISTLDGKTPLYIAVHNSHYSVVEKLLETYSNLRVNDVNTICIDGTTPLWAAIRNQRLDIASLLKKQEDALNCNVVDWHGQTLFEMASKFTNSAAINWLNLNCFQDYVPQNQHSASDDEGTMEKQQLHGTSDSHSDEL